MWFESRIPPVVVQVSFPHSVLMLGFLKILLISPNHVPNHSCWSNSLRTESSWNSKSGSLQSQCYSTWLRSSVGGNCLKTGTGNLSEWGIGLTADGRLGYSILPLLFLLNPDVFTNEK